MSKGKAWGFGFLLSVTLLGGRLWPAQGLIERFPLGPSDLALERPARPQTYFDKVGRKFAVLGSESGTFEAWAYPLKILRDFEISFFIGSSTRPIPGRDIVHFVEAAPAVTTLTYVFQSFTVRASFITAVDEPGAVILLAVDSVEPLTIVCGFLPVLQPMWPAGLGGQYAYWDDGLKAYLISEPRRLNHGLVGSPAAEGMSYTPAHMLADTPNEFKIIVADPAGVRDKFIPLILAGGRGDGEAVKGVYRRLEADPRAVYRQAEHFRGLRADTLRLSTPDKDLDLAFEWAKVALDNLLVDNPDLGLGLVAGLGPSGSGGRPGFGWFFGTDAFFNSLSLNGYGAFSATRAALTFIRERQRADGKIMHELSQAAGFVDWFKDYPYGYIHADTTPYYIVAVGDYVFRSGDLDFLKDSWASLDRAFQYCLSTDANADGLMDNRRAGLGALEFGALTGIETDIYLGAVWVEACRVMEKLALLAADRKTAAAAAGRFSRASEAFETKFWDETAGYYAYAFNAQGQRVAEVTPWPAVGLFFRLGTPEHALKTLERLNREDMTTDWGIRMMSEQSRFYEPLNYNYGACWPFLAGYAAAALYEHGQDLQGFALIKAGVRHTFDNGLGYITELFSGHQNIWPAEAVPHQGFSTGGLVLPLLRGLLGLEGDAPAKEIVFRPRLPGDWPGIEVENFKLGKASIGLSLRREPGRLTLRISGSSLEGWRMTFNPSLAGCSGLGGVRVNGRAVSPVIEGSGHPFAPSLSWTLGPSDTLEMDLRPAADFMGPDSFSRTGDSNHGLKVVRVVQGGERLTAEVEGLAGREYGLPLLNPGLVAGVEGGRIEGRLLKFSLPAGPPGAFVRHELTIIRK
jgi:glycogen debranching enzyme